MKTILFALCLAVLFGGCTEKQLRQNTRDFNYLMSDVFSTDDEWMLLNDGYMLMGSANDAIKSDYKRIRNAEYIPPNNVKDRKLVQKMLSGYRDAKYICAIQKEKDRAKFWADKICDSYDTIGADACATLGEIFKYDDLQYAISKFKQGAKGKSPKAYHGLAEIYASTDYKKASVYRARGCRIQGYGPADENCQEIRELEFSSPEEAKKFRSTVCSAYKKTKKK